MAITRNAYRRAWFDTFARTVDHDATAREIAFLERVLPRAEFPRILDLACGAGRHAIPLARDGYTILGVDRSKREIALAKDRAPKGCAFRIHDMRALGGLDGGPFDACISMWQSFGYFDDATNERILADIAGLLRPGGRLVLDICNREHFEETQGVRRFDRAGTWVNENRWIERNRLRVHLSRDGGALMDVFEWRLYTPDELATAGRRCGLAEIMRCAAFDESKPPSEGEPRMQLVLERA